MNTAPISVEALDSELAAKLDVASRAKTKEERDEIVLHVCLEAVRWYPGLRQTRNALLAHTYLKEVDRSE